MLWLVLLGLQVGLIPTELCFGPFLMLSSSSTGEWC